MKIAYDAVQCIFQHVGNFNPDGGISQLIIVRLSNEFQYYDGHFTGFHLIITIAVLNIAGECGNSPS